MEKEKKDKSIDLLKCAKICWKNRKSYFKVWVVVFTLACLWIFPQPRYYKCEISLAPESSGEDIGSGLLSVASSFGFNIGGASADAIYPTLYPDLFESTEFLCRILAIQVVSEDGSINTSYYDYMKNHQQKNWLTYPFKKAVSSIKKLFVKKKSVAVGSPDGLNPFKLSEDDYNLVEKVKDKIACNHDKKTDVTTICIEDQDPYVAACLADSVCLRLQSFITDYRTGKARMDADFYKMLYDSAYAEYEVVLKKYTDFCESNLNVYRQSVISQRELLRNEVSQKQTICQGYQVQYQSMKSKVQEKTPVFMVLKPATVPIKPAGPKRVLFVLGMLILSTACLTVYLLRREIFNLEKRN